MLKVLDVAIAASCAALAVGSVQEHRPILAVCFAVLALVNLIDYAKRPLG